MISKAKIKQIHALEHKKFRDEYGLFVAEGNKLVSELLPAFECKTLLATTDWLKQNSTVKATEIIEVTAQDLDGTSFQKSPQQVLAIFFQRKDKYDTTIIADELTLALDDVQDPGNLGTIVRIADWFGIHHIFCSLHCADIYNPKATQATMGALARVQLHYLNLSDFLAHLPKNYPIYGTALHGENIYKTELQNRGIIVMGNEGNGISENVSKYVSQALYFPNYPIGEKTSESLNVAIATAVICAEFRRLK